VSAGCGCGRRWTGLAEAHCPRCHAHFSRVSNFDRHLPLTGPCRPPAEAGLVLDARDVWRMPAPTDRDAPHGGAA
jgi:hypothetical protein